jgi:hypothetical protein
LVAGKKVGAEAVESAQGKRLLKVRAECRKRLLATVTGVTLVTVIARLRHRPFWPRFSSRSGRCSHARKIAGKCPQVVIERPGPGEGGCVTDLGKFLVFKPVSDGYVYRAPNQWLFGTRAHFLVTDSQRATLLATATSSTQPVLWLTGSDRRRTDFACSTQTRRDRQRRSDGSGLRCNDLASN